MTILMFFHVLAGTLAVLAGSTAMLTEKGSITHRAAGNLFFVSMLIMGVAGSIIAFHLPQMITFIAGLFTCYLIVTAWLTVKTQPRSRNILDFVTFLAVLCIAVLALYSGYQASNSDNGTLDGFSAEPYFFFAGLALFALFLDAIYLYKNGFQGKLRIARHLWRMCFALYIAVGSLFTGPGAQIFPASLQGNWMLSLPEYAVAMAMLIWLAIVLFTDKLTTKQEYSAFK